MPMTLWGMAENFLFCVIDELLFNIAAIATVVSVTEILKNNGLAVEKSKNFSTPLFHTP